MPAGCIERSKSRVERQRASANGASGGPPKGVTPNANGLQVFTFPGKFCALGGRDFLFVEGRTKYGDDEMREVGSALIQLQPPDHAMLRQILGHA